MDVLIYGAGAVGLGWASCLLKAGVTVSLVARPTTVAALQRHGLTRDGLFGTYHAPPDRFRAVDTLDALAPRPVDVIVVSTKSFDSAAAAADLQAHRDFFGPATRLVLAQNGWGNAEQFLPHVPESQLYHARVITGFERPEPHRVTITVHADAVHLGNRWGRPEADLAPLAAALSRGGLPCVTTDRITADLWAKMLFNCTLNPLGAILAVPYGALAAQPSTVALMNRLAEEIFAVCRAAGIGLHWATCAAFLEDFYGHQVPATAQHHSSTLQDIRAGRRTEIDALNGQVIALAARHRIAVPTNDTVYRLVRFIETASGSSAGRPRQEALP